MRVVNKTRYAQLLINTGVIWHQNFTVSALNDGTDIRVAHVDGIRIISVWHSLNTQEDLYAIGNIGAFKLQLFGEFRGVLCNLSFAIFKITGLKFPKRNFQRAAAGEFTALRYRN